MNPKQTLNVNVKDDGHLQIVLSRQASLVANLCACFVVWAEVDYLKQEV